MVATLRYDAVTALEDTLRHELTPARTRRLAEVLCEALALDAGVVDDPLWAGRLVRLALLVPDEALPDEDELDPVLLEARAALLGGAHRKAVEAMREVGPRMLLVDDTGYYTTRRVPGGLFTASVFGKHDQVALDARESLPMSTRLLTLYWPTRVRGGGRRDVVPAWWPASSVAATLLDWAMVEGLESLDGGRFGWPMMIDVMFELVAAGEDTARLGRLLVAELPALDPARAEAVVRVCTASPWLVAGRAVNYEREVRAHYLNGLTSLLADAGDDPRRPLPLVPPWSDAVMHSLEAMLLLDQVPERLPRHWHNVKLAERRRRVRQIVACLERPEDLVELDLPMTVARQLALATPYTYTLVEGDELEAQLPRAVVLAELGCHPDGSMPAALDEDLKAEPVSRLRLAADHPVLAEVPATAPIATALGWARRHGASSAAGQAVWDAWWQFRTERRWLATLPRVRAGVPVYRAYAAPFIYELLVGAIDEVFDDAVGAHRFDVLGLSGAIDKRVRKALAACKHEGRLDALPTRASDLLSVRGFGPATLEALVEALWQHLCTWRGTRPTVAGRRMAEAAEVEDGLAALAVMFGSGHDSD